MDYKKFIVDSIQNMSGELTPYQIFTDWIKMFSISISNTASTFKKHDEIIDEREKIYQNTASAYTKSDMQTISDMCEALICTYEERFGDILGEIYMEAGCANKTTGQFFTPYFLSYLTAASIYSDIEPDKIIKINESACGSGGMIIAAANVMHDKGIDYQRCMRVIAQDLDWNGVYMTYIQLSFLGIRAKVIQGDALSEPFHAGYDERRVFRTPAELGMTI